MSKRIVSQAEEEVKCSIEDCHEYIFCDGVCFNHFVRLRRIKEDLACAKCADKHCHEYVFRGGLCLEHYVEEETAAWDDHTDEVAQAHAVSVGRG